LTEEVSGMTFMTVDFCTPECCRISLRHFLREPWQIFNEAMV